jgi:hypothetical protein
MSLSASKRHLNLFESAKYGLFEPKVIIATDSSVKKICVIEKNHQCRHPQSLK